MSRPVVVVGVGAARASTAIRAAAELATAVGGELVAVHVRQAPVVVGPELGAAVGASLVAERLVDERAHEISAAALRPYALLWRFEPRNGDVALELLQVADEYDALCIVIGRRERRPIARALVGSLAHRLVDNAPRPVMVVPCPG